MSSRRAAIPRPESSSIRPAEVMVTSHSSTTPVNTRSPSRSPWNITQSSGLVGFSPSQGQRSQKLSQGTPAV